MPVYEYQCEQCGNKEDHVRPYKDRKGPIDCRLCGGSMQYVFSGSVHLGSERITGDNRLIWNEKQLKPMWREEGTNLRPGGAGKTLYFHD